MVSTDSKHILTFIRYDDFYENYIKIRKTKGILFKHVFFLQHSAKFNAQMIIVKLSKLAIKEGVAHFIRRSYIYKKKAKTGNGKQLSDCIAIAFLRLLSLCTEIFH